jgi:hypothetical protein
LESHSWRQAPVSKRQEICLSDVFLSFAVILRLSGNNDKDPITW